MLLLLSELGVFCKQGAAPWESIPFMQTPSHCFISDLILSSLSLSIVQPPYVTQKKCVAADIMIISAVGDKNSSPPWPGRRCERGDAAAVDYLKDNLCYLCHQDNDRR